MKSKNGVPARFHLKGAALFGPVAFHPHKFGDDAQTCPGGALEQLLDFLQKVQ